MQNKVFNLFLKFLKYLWAILKKNYLSLLPCVGFSLRWLLLGSTDLEATGFSSHGSWALEHGPRICGVWAYLLLRLWDLLGLGIRPVSPSLAGGVFTPEPPGKSSTFSSIPKNSPNIFATVSMVLGSDGFRVKYPTNEFFCQGIQ